MLKVLITLYAIIILSACQNTSEQTNNKAPINYFLDDEFPTYKEQPIESRKEIFNLAPEIITALSGEFSRNERAEIRLTQFMQKIVGKPNQDILYDANADLTATQAYYNKTANCLSLSIMAYSLAKQAGIDVEFREVKIPELWTSRDGNRLANGHINVTLKLSEYIENRGTNTYKKSLDFAPEIAQQNFKTKSISKKKVQALFYNNKAANAIMKNHYDLAYAYLKAALKLYPTDSPSWSNLGLLYKRKSHYLAAEQTLLKAANLEKTNYTPLDNLASLYRHTGRMEEANKIKRTLAFKRKKNPYYHALKADIAYEEGDMQGALKAYKKAISLDADVDDFYWGAAKAYLALGNLEMSLTFLNRAKHHSQFDDVARRYQGKINRLKNLHAYQQ